VGSYSVISTSKQVNKQVGKQVDKSMKTSDEEVEIDENTGL
jgi:hypothetical protein